MRTTRYRAIIPTCIATLGAYVAGHAALGQAPRPRYSQMAPVEQYLMADRAAEIALARSAAPPSISREAAVLVLDRTGYVTAARGTNGFVCIVERSWDAPSTDPQFWNPKIRGPNCFNPAAARTYLPMILMKTQLALAGKARADVTRAISAALDAGTLPALAPGAMCYMLSKQQYVNDDGKGWRPHLMLFVAGDAADGWGANRDGVPVLATNDPGDRLTIMIVPVSHWSDGTPAGTM